MKEPIYQPPVELLEFFYPGRLREGMSFQRLEYCYVCKSDQTHTFILRTLTPRYWIYHCHDCSNPPPED